MRSFVLFCLILLGFAAVDHAQAQTPDAPFSTLDAPQPFPKNFGTIRMAPGTIRLFKAKGPIKSVLLARAEVAEITLLAEDLFAITAKQEGTSSMLALGPDNQVTSSGDLVIFPLRPSAAPSATPSAAPSAAALPLTVAVRAFPGGPVFYRCDPELSNNDEHPCNFNRANIPPSAAPAASPATLSAGSPATPSTAPAAPQVAPPPPSQSGR